MSEEALEALRSTVVPLLMPRVVRCLSLSTLVVKKGSVTAKEAMKLCGVYGMKPTAVADINIYEGRYTNHRDSVYHFSKQELLVRSVFSP